MRVFRLVSLLATVLVSALPVTSPVLGSKSPAPGSKLPWPGGARADLVIPDSLWSGVLSHLGREGRSLGFTADEMAGFGRDALILRPVKNLYRDVRSIPRFGGKTAEDLIANAADPSEMVQRAFGLTDVAAGRMLPLPDSTTWGVDWMAKDAKPDAALDAVLAYVDQGRSGRMSDSDRRAWWTLPERVQRLVIRIIVGAAEGSPWIRKAWENPAFAEVGGAAGDTAALGARYRFAMAPWVGRAHGSVRDPVTEVHRGAGGPGPGIPGVRLRHLSLPFPASAEGVPGRDRAAPGGSGRDPGLVRRVRLRDRLRSRAHLRTRR